MTELPRSCEKEMRERYRRNPESYPGRLEVMRALGLPEHLSLHAGGVAGGARDLTTHQRALRCGVNPAQQLERREDPLDDGHSHRGPIS